MDQSKLELMLEGMLRSLDMPLSARMDKGEILTGADCDPLPSGITSLKKILDYNAAKQMLTYFQFLAWEGAPDILRYSSIGYGFAIDYLCKGNHEQIRVYFNRECLYETGSLADHYDQFKDNIIFSFSQKTTSHTFEAHFHHNPKDVDEFDFVFGKTDKQMFRQYRKFAKSLTDGSIPGLSERVIISKLGKFLPAYFAFVR